jgi:dUTP pyrophosphatase
MDEIQVRIINRSGNEVPQYATKGSAGMDIRAFVEASITIQPLERLLIPTGIFLEIPQGYEAQVRPRSGLALKQGITCLNTPGTIDSDYRGEVKVLLINLSNETQVIHDGDRIAQIVFAKTACADLLVVQQLDDTLRGQGGFGHTGVK